MNKFEATQYFLEFGVPEDEVPVALIMMGLASQHEDVESWSGATPVEVQRVTARLQESGIDPVVECDDWDDPVKLTMALMVGKGDAVRLPNGSYTKARATQ